jgi:hypothetical protein
MRRYSRDSRGRFARTPSGTGGARPNPRTVANVSAHAGAAAVNYSRGHRATAALHGAKIATVTARSTVRRAGPSYVKRGGTASRTAKRTLQVKGAENGLAKAEKYVDKALAASYIGITGGKVASKSIKSAATYSAAKQTSRLGVFGF